MSRRVPGVGPEKVGSSEAAKATVANAGSRADNSVVRGDLFIGGWSHSKRGSRSKLTFDTKRGERAHAHGSVSFGPIRGIG